ncbi:cytochrome P450 [Sphingomonas sp. SRS2]|uniref:cytochrome P450 n=1 Tax=Sphingomonas sp. SRS2 TaxID=133190 RepID=UPI0006184024|nr:cytochrome P450 [Sphingomonas sp. SRS2]KKC26994.1 hypothetical protein WP12_05905 [Sphingomonas sp. SRS2]
MSLNDVSDRADAGSTRDWSCYTTPPAESLELFDAVRDVRPFARSEEHQGFHMLLSYKDVRKAMSDYRTFSSEPQVLRPMLPRKPIPALEMDPPRHGHWRAIFNGAITSRTPESMEPFLRADIRHHINEFIERGRCDIVREIAEPVPAEAICHMVGIDEENVPEIRKRAIAMFAAQGDPALFGQRQAEFGEVTVAEVHARKRAPRDDYMTALAGMEIEGQPLDDDDYVVLLAAFLGAGHHSTTSAMASMIYEVFSRPELRDRLRAEPALIPRAIEEVLRLRPPFYGFFRRTTKAVEIDGAEIPAGEDVYMGWAAANRDPAVFDRPAEFDMDRENSRHLSFGFGIHVCPGAPLARMEMKVLLEELLDALPDMHVVSGKPVYQFGGGDYCYIPEVQVAFTPRPRLD